VPIENSRSRVSLALPARLRSLRFPPRRLMCSSAICCDILLILHQARRARNAETRLICGGRASISRVKVKGQSGSMGVSNLPTRLSDPPATPRARSRTHAGAMEIDSSAEEDRLRERLTASSSRCIATLARRHSHGSTRATLGDPCTLASSEGRIARTVVRGDPHPCGGSLAA